MSAITSRDDRSVRRLLARLSRRRRPVCGAFALIVATMPGSAPVSAAPCWRPPVAAAVADPFRQPDCPWCPGNRGIEYATTLGDDVTSVAAGTVSFAGSIAGVRYVVVDLSNHWRVTYGNLSHSELQVGEVVVTGMVVGSAARAFHFGLRDGDTYIDPAPYLGAWQFRVRLVPIDGSRATPGRPPTLRCDAGGQRREPSVHR
jgi:murein DD-endopeptidase MepM/ murein hydrolase activator NlpD